MTTDTDTQPPLEQHLEGLHRLHRGKVRDIFAVDRNQMLLVATDRVSAFDVVLPQRLPGKGIGLKNTQIHVGNYFINCRLLSQ